MDSGGEGDGYSHGGESLGELEGGVYVPLYWVCYEEETVLHHCSGGA